MENKKFSIVWQEFSSGSDIAKRFWVEDKEGFLPFFIEGENLKKLENKERIKLNELMLLRGILVGLGQKAKLFVPKENDELLICLLPILREGFRIPSIEMMILDLAFNLKNNISTYSSYLALKGGLKVISNSDMIRSDLLNIIWELWEENPENGYNLMEEVIENFEKINLEGILPGAIEMIVYITFIALFFKQPKKINDFLEKYVFVYIEKRVLKNRIKYLLENKNSTIKDAFWK